MKNFITGAVVVLPLTAVGVWGILWPPAFLIYLAIFVIWLCWMVGVNINES